MTDNKDIIDSTFHEIYNVLSIHKDDKDIVKEFIHHIDKLNINTFFTEDSKEEIINYIIENSDRQEAVLDFINSLNVRLKINGLDTVEVFKSIKDSFKAFSTSKELPENLLELLKPNDDQDIGVVIEMSFLIRMYGINLITELK